MEPWFPFCVFGSVAPPWFFYFGIGNPIRHDLSRKKNVFFREMPERNFFGEVIPYGYITFWIEVGPHSSVQYSKKLWATKLMKKIGKFFCFETSMNFRSSYPPCSTFCQSFQTHRFVNWQLTFIKLQMRQNLIFAKFSYQVSGSIPSNGPHHQQDSPQISYLSYTILLNRRILNWEHKKETIYFLL